MAENTRNLEQFVESKLKDASPQFMKQLKEIQSKLITNSLFHKHSEIKISGRGKRVYTSSQPKHQLRNIKL